MDQKVLRMIQAVRKYVSDAEERETIHHEPMDTCHTLDQHLDKYKTA